MTRLGLGGLVVCAGGALSGLAQAQASAEPAVPVTVGTAPRAVLGPQEASAGPATAAGSTGVRVELGLELIAGYGLRLTPMPSGTQWYHDFELPRAHASVTGRAGPVEGRIVLEAVRSASEGALMGVAGDSLLMRLREARVGYRPWRWVSLELGVVPTLTVPVLDGTFAMRAVAATPLESTGLMAPADLGASARLLLPWGLGALSVGAFNGEGYTNRELNRGKNLELALELRPAPQGPVRPLMLFASFQDGSAGTGSARALRLTAGLVWQGVRLRAGLDGTFAWGVGEDGLVRSWLLDAFVRAEPLDRWLLGARGFHWVRDVARVGVGDRVTELTAATGFRVAEPLEAYLTVTRSLPGAAAATALPGLDRWDMRLLGRVVF